MFGQFGSGFKELGALDHVIPRHVHQGKLLRVREQRRCSLSLAKEINELLGESQTYSMSLVSTIGDFHPINNEELRVVGFVVATLWMTKICGISSKGKFCRMTPC